MGLGLLLILSEKEEVTEGRKAGWASKLKPGPFLRAKSGSATVNNTVLPCVYLFIYLDGS